MRCSYCGKKAVLALPYVDRKLCKGHFIRMIDKRVREAVRRYEMIKKGERIFVERSGRHAAALAFALNELKKDLPFVLVAEKKNADRVARPEDIDDLAESVLKGIATNKRTAFGFVEKRTIRPFLGIPGEELSLYAKLNGCKEQKGRKRKNACEKQVLKLLKITEKRHPGARFQIMGSYAEIGNIWK